MPVADRKIGSSAISALVGTGASASPGVAWSNPTNVETDDSNYATVSLSGAAPNSETLLGTALTLSPPVPASVRLTSISYTVIAKSQTNVVKDLTAQLWDGSAAIGTDQALGTALASTDESREYVFDVTGLGITAADVLASGFGLFYRAARVSGISAVAAVRLIENVTVEWTMRRNRTGGF